MIDVSQLRAQSRNNGRALAWPIGPFWKIHTSLLQSGGESGEMYEDGSDVMLGIASTEKAADNPIMKKRSKLGGVPVWLLSFVSTMTWFLSVMAWNPAFDITSTLQKMLS
jgi:hypothetical protein